MKSLFLQYQGPQYQNVPNRYEPLTPENQVARSATGKFYISSTNGEEGTGTGFSIGNGLFLTAGHNIIKDFDINESFIDFEDDGNFQCKVEKIISYENSNGLDFALIKLDGKPNWQLDVNLSLDPSNLLRQEVFIPQYPSGGTIEVSRGIITNMDFGDGSAGYAEISNLSAYEGENYFRYTCPTMKGSSGSPIILNGEVIGIHVRGIEDTQDIHTATKIFSIKPLIEQAMQAFSNFSPSY